MFNPFRFDFKAPVLFLKAVVKKKIWVPTYTKKDGTVVQAHEATVKASTNHDDAAVAGGGQSFYQKMAHKHLAEQHKDFHSWHEAHKVGAVLHLATHLQDEASSSAAVSKLKKDLLKGKKPKPAQLKAFSAASDERKAEVMSAVMAAGLADHFNAHVEGAKIVDGVPSVVKDGKLVPVAKKQKLSTAAVKKKKGSRKMDPAVDDLLAAIAKSGGLDVNEARAQGIDPEHFKKRGYAIFRVFHRNGLTFDDMAHNILGPAGYPVSGGANDLLERLSEALDGGKKIYTASGYEYAMEKEYQEAMDDEPPPPDWLDDSFDPFADAPAMEFSEDEYESEWSSHDSVIFELVTQANKIKDGAGEDILERASVKELTPYETIESLKSFISEHSEKGEGEPGEGPGSEAAQAEAGGAEGLGGAELTDSEKEKLSEKLTFLNDMISDNPGHKNLDAWKAKAAEISGKLGVAVKEKESPVAAEKKNSVDMTGWSDPKKAAFALSQEYKNLDLLNQKAVGAFKNKLRALAKKTPSDDDGAVFLIDNLVTKLWGTDYNPKVADVQFAKPASGSGKGSGVEVGSDDDLSNEIRKPILKGTDKQVAWATDIIKKLREACDLVVAKGKDENARALLKKGADALMSHWLDKSGGHADWYINYFHGVAKQTAEDVESGWDIRGKIVAEAKKIMDIGGGGLSEKKVAKSFSAAPDPRVLFLKAVVKTQVWVPGYTKKDGTVVRPHFATVNVDPNHDDHKVASGQGKHYEKEAHAHLSKNPEYHAQPVGHQAAQVLHYGTHLQKEASQKANVSKFKSELLAGKVPTASMKSAFLAASPEKQAEVKADLDAAGKLDAFQQVMGGDSSGLNSPEPSSPSVSLPDPSPDLDLDDIPLVDENAPIPKGAKKIIDQHAAWGNGVYLEHVVASNAVTNPHISKYAKKMLDRLGSKSAAPGATPAPAQPAAAPAGDPGPKDGDTKQGADGTLVFKNGRWHKQGGGSKVTPLHVFKDDQNGVAAHVTKTPQGYHVSVQDTDTGEFLPTSKIYPTEDSAVAYAKKVAGIKDAQAAPSAQQMIDDAVAKDAADDADYAAKLDEISKLAKSNYKRVAYDKLKATPEWSGWPNQHRYAQVMELYNKLQGAASHNSNVSKWKKEMMAGKVPTTGQHKSFNLLPQAEQLKHINDLVTAHGVDKATELLGQAHAKLAGAVKAKKPGIVPAAKPAAAPAPAARAPAPAVSAAAPDPSAPKAVTNDEVKNLKLAPSSKTYANYQIASALNYPADHKYVFLDDRGEVTAAISFDHKADGLPVEIHYLGSTVKGQGSALMKLALDYADSHGVATNVLAMHGSKGFHEKFGFKTAADQNLADIGGMVRPPAAPAAAAQAPGGNDPNVVGWADSILAGQEPTARQAAAFEALSDTEKTDIATEVAIEMAADAGVDPSDDPDEFDNVMGVFHAKVEKLHAAALKNTPKPSAPADWDIKHFVHTKKGHDVWSVQKPKSLDDDEFKKATALAKKYGGFWSSFKGPNTYPGFYFKTAGDAKAFSMAIGKDIPNPLASGPKEGDTRVINGVEYVLRGGRWHRVTPRDNSAGGAAQAITSHSGYTVGDELPDLKDVVQKLPAGTVIQLNNGSGPDRKVLLGKYEAWLEKLDGSGWSKKSMSPPEIKLLLDGEFSKKALPTLFSIGAPGWMSQDQEVMVPVVLSAKQGTDPEVSTYKFKGQNGGSILVGNPKKPGLFSHVSEDGLVGIGFTARQQKKLRNGEIEPFPIPGVSAPAPAAAAPAAAPAAPTTPAPGPAAAEDISGWSMVGGQKGSNPGGLYEDASGQKWYVKFPATEDHVKNEVLAAKLYEAAGIDMPEVKMISQGGKVGVASKYIDGLKNDVAALKKMAANSTGGVGKGFAVDAWLGNWDVVGTGFDNMLVGPDGKAYRIDPGGALLYRAQGTPKGAAFGDDVTELESLKDAAKNPYAAEVFAGVDDMDVKLSAHYVANVTDQAIHDLVMAHGPGDQAARQALAEKLIKRKQSLLGKLGITVLSIQPAAPAPTPAPTPAPAAPAPAPNKPDPTALQVDTSMLPEKPNFLNWKNQGSGLSSVYAVNKANQDAVDEIEAAALKGNYVAIKNLQINVVDKATGTATLAPAYTHPSQHVKNYFSAVVDYLSVLANPAAHLPKQWREKAVSSVKDMSKKFAAHFYGVAVDHVPASIRLGFWIQLGNVKNASKVIPKKEQNVPQHVKDIGGKAVQKYTGILKTWLAAVKATGHNNKPYRDGLEVDYQGNKTREVLKDAYDHAIELGEGSILLKGMDMPPGMFNQIFQNKVPDGHVFQNPGSMCTSLNSGHSWSGNVMLEMVCAKGAKGLYNIGVGAYDSEGEITTLPGQRFMIISRSQHNPKYGKAHLKVLMLPPDETYVANIGNKAASDDAIAKLQQVI